MEKFPMRERKEAPKEISQVEVSSLLKEKGFDDPEAKELFTAWREEQHQKVESGILTLLDFNIAWAEVYRDAGNVQSARESYEACVVLARNLGQVEIINELLDQISNLPDLVEPI